MPPLEAVDIQIENGLILTLDGERRIIHDGAVAIRGQRIVGVGKTTDLAAAYAPVRRLDARDRLIMPGLINCHHHFMDPFRGLIPDDLNPREWVRDWAWPLFAELTPEEEHDHAYLLIANMLRTGTTCVADAGAKDLGGVVHAVAEAGLRAVLCKWTWDQRGPGQVTYAYPDFLLEDTDQALATTEDALKRFHRTADGRITISAGFENLGSASERLMTGLKALADTWGTILYTHLLSSQAEADMWLKGTGRTGVRYLDDLGLLDQNAVFSHMVVVEEDEIPLLRDRDAKIVHNPVNCFRLAKGASRISRFVEMLRAGLTVALGVDSCNSGGTYDMVRVMHAAAGLARDSRQDASALVGETAVEMATRHGARALGLDGDIGSIEVGKKADLILFDLSRPEWLPLFNPVYNLVWSATGDSVDTVIIDGRPVMERRQILTFNEEAVIRRVRSYQPKILARMTQKGRRVGPRWPVV